MGLGAAASEPGTLSMLRHLYPDARARSRAIGVWAATSGFALAAGPVVGGVLTGVWSWRGIFWFNLVFGLAALIVAAVILPESADPTAARSTSRARSSAPGLWPRSCSRSSTRSRPASARPT